MGCHGAAGRVKECHSFEKIILKMAVLKTISSPTVYNRGLPDLASAKLWDFLTPSPLSAFGTDLRSSAEAN